MAVKESTSGRGGFRPGSGRPRTRPRELTCERCGTLFTNERGRNKFCSLACRSGTVDRQCIQCGQTFTVPRRKIRRVCCSDGCIRARLRVACTPPAPLRTCRACGCKFKKRTGGKGWYCSRQCGFAGRAARKRDRIEAERQAKAQAAIQRTAERAARRQAKADRRQQIYFAPKSCAVCGNEFIPRRALSPAAHCSLSCYRKAHPRIKKREHGKKHTDRARRFGVPRVYNIKPRQVYDRDGWVCGICHRPIPKRLYGTNQDDAPAIDHIIPLSTPGSPGHVWANVQASHRCCNSRKGVRSIGQPRFF